MKKTMKWLIMPMLVLCMLLSGVSASAASAKISKKSATLTVGKSITLSVKNNKKKVTWKTNNKKVATVSQKGVVTAKKQGKATITATVGAKKYTCKVTVKAAPKVKKVKLNKTSASVGVGQKLQLQASVLPANAGNKSVKWSSSNKKVATVSNKGVVTAKKAGSATITATAADGSKKKASCKLTVVKSGKPSGTGTQDGSDNKGGTGAQGNTGNKGDTGSQGSTGTQSGSSNQGSTGTQNGSGNQGSTGTQGGSGDQGSTGTQGGSGNQGSTGTQGGAGNQGSTGTQGGSGNQGGTGTQSGSGNQGTTGNQGDSGSQTTPGTAKTVVEIRATCSLTSASSIDEVEAASFSVYKIYSDGSEEKGSPADYTVTIKDNSSSDVYVCTIESKDGKYKCTLTVKKNLPTVTDIVASCIYQEVPYEHSFKTTDFEVYEVYSDGTKKKAAHKVTEKIAYADGYYVVTVTCEGIEKQLKVKVTNPPAAGDTSADTPTDIPTLTSLRYSMNPAYVYVGEGLKDGQLRVTAKYSDRTSEEVKNYTCDFTPQKTAGLCKFKVEYQGIVNELTIQVIEKPVEATITGIEASCKLDEVTLEYDFSAEDFEVYAIYSDGTKRPVGFEFTGKYADGYYNITITSGSYKKELQVKVTNPPTESDTPYLTGVRFELSPSWVYVGEDLKEDQIIVTARYSDGSSQIVKDFQCDFTPKSTAGKYTFNVTWGNVTRQFTIEVRDRSSEPEEARLTGLDAEFNRNYIYSDEEPVASDILLTGTYSDGSVKKIEDFTFDFTPATEHKGQAVITIHYGEYSLTLSVTSLVRTEPKWVEFRYKFDKIKVNENISKDWIQVFATDYDGNVTETKDFSITFTPQSIPGTYPCTVSYKGFSKTLMVEVVAE